MQLSPSDIAANKAGNLSAMQIRRLKVRRMMWGLATLGAGLMLLLALVSVVLLLGLGAGSEGGFLVVFAFVGLLWAALLSPMPLKFWRATQELDSNEVVVSEGRIRQHMSTVPVGMIRPTRYYIEQGDNRFEVSKAVFFTFKNGDPYTLYYTPQTKLLVGAQHITSADYFVPENDASDVDDLDFYDDNALSQSQHQ